MTNINYNTKEKKKAFLAHFERTKGNISLSCKAANICRETYYEWCRKDPKFKKNTIELDAGTDDYVESKLMKLIGNDSPTAIIFYCKTKLKDRGYVERVETTGKDGASLPSPNITVVNSPDVATAAATYNDILKDS